MNLHNPASWRFLPIQSSLRQNNSSEIGWRPRVRVTDDQNLFVNDMGTFLAKGKHYEVYIEDSCQGLVVKEGYANSVSNNVEKYTRRNQNLYCLCEIYGIPAAISKFYLNKNDSTIIQKRCFPIPECFPRKIEAFENILDKIIELWCLGIFVLFELTSENLMLSDDNRIVMTGFGGGVRMIILRVANLLSFTCILFYQMVGI